MRRLERAITERAAIDTIIRACQICRLGLCDGTEPYVVPVCFGYDGEAIHVHCAQEGRKLDILRRNPRVCVEFDIFDGLRLDDQACRSSMRYRSVIAVGRALFVEDLDEKRRSLGLIMLQYSDQDHAFGDEAVRKTCVVRVTIERISGKQA